MTIPAPDAPDVRARHRDHLAAFTWDAGRWRQVSFQIDRTNDSGDKLHWEPDYALPERRNFYKNDPRPVAQVNALDNLVLNERELLPCDEACRKAAQSPAPCGPAERPGTFVAFIELPQTQRAALVADCHAPVERKGVAVTVDTKSRTLQSERFRYVYSADNNLLFDEFSLREGNGKFLPLLTGSEFHLYAKPKLFFPLHFTRKDITSKLIGYTREPLSTTGELSFELKVLMFKIKLDLMSTVSMYEDAIEIPVILNLPVSGSMLREGSGVYYGFKYAGGNLWKEVSTDFPRLPKPGAAIPFAAQRSFSLDHKGTFVLTSVRMPDSFRAMNFSPAIATPSELKEWNFPRPSTDFGVFYDITRLRKGSHRLAVWFYIGSSGDEPLLRTYAREGIRYNVTSVKKL